MRRLLTIISVISAFSLPVQAQENVEVEPELRLLPIPCKNKSSPSYYTSKCQNLITLVESKLFDCEVKRGGLLIRDDARRLLVCVKASKLSE